jgi:hypothetical protein
VAYVYLLIRLPSKQGLSTGITAKKNISVGELLFLSYVKAITLKQIGKVGGQLSTGNP